MSTSAVVIHYKEALYQVYAHLPVMAAYWQLWSLLDYYYVADDRIQCDPRSPPVTTCVYSPCPYPHTLNWDHCRSPLTVEHILTSCSAYKNIIEKNIINTHSSQTISTFLNNTYLNYLSKILNVLFSLLHDIAYLCCVQPQPTSSHIAWASFLNSHRTYWSRLKT